jgi:hypothetical protein
VAKEKTEPLASPLSSEQYWCSIVMLLLEAEEDLIESSVHHKTTLPHSNTQSSAIRPRGQRPHLKRKAKMYFPCNAPVSLFPFPSSDFPFCGLHLLRNFLFHSHHLYFLLYNFINLRNVLCFLLGNSPASEFYMTTFRNTLLHLHRQVGK